LIVGLIANLSATAQSGAVADGSSRSAAQTEVVSCGGRLGAFKPDILQPTV